MTLPLVKPISMTQIEAEFSAPAGTPLSAFVRGGAWVPDTAQNSGVPVAEPIAMSDLLGASAVVPQYQWQGSTSYTQAGIGTVQARLTFDNDGGGSDDFSGGNFSGWWSSQPAPGIGTGRFVRWNHQSGDGLNFGSPDDTWVELLGSNFGMSTGSGTIRSGTFDVEFSDDGISVDYTQPGVSLTVDAT